MRAIVTGATGGIGRAVCLKLAKSGYEIIMTGIDSNQAKEAVEYLQKEGVCVHYYENDATDESQVKALYSTLSEQFDCVDVLVNNVGGLGGRQRFSEMETSFMRSVMALNFDSAYFNTKYALPLLKKGTAPSIINYSSIAVTSGGGLGAGVYVASKAAVEGLTRALAKDLGEFGIRVNGVSPGTIDTAFHSGTAREVMETWKQSIVMKRFGDPSEVANVIAFLVSDQASFLTGEIIQVNGGQAFI